MADVRHQHYLHVKNELKLKIIPYDQLEEIKESYDDAIDSVRLKSCIQNIGDLIDSLERRDIINENKTRALSRVAKILENSGLDNMLIDEKPSNQNAHVNQYALERLREEQEERLRMGRLQQNHIEVNGCFAENRVNTQPNNNPFNAALFSGINKAAIYKLISTEIGRNWRDFGRGLNIREGEMDALDSDFPRDFKTKIYKLLEMFEEPGREDPKKHVLMICNALEDCRRKDLSRKIQEILTR